jgi:hypothetical protein
MKKNYVLIDLENVQVKSLALLVADHSRVHLFPGPNYTRLPTHLASARITSGWKRPGRTRWTSTSPNTSGNWPRATRRASITSSRRTPASIR